MSFGLGVEHTAQTPLCDVAVANRLHSGTSVPESRSAVAIFRTLFANKEAEHLDSKSVPIVKAYIGK